MKFCSACKKLHDGADTICTDCNKKYKDIVDINEPVMLCVVGGTERSMICGALTDANIPFVEMQYGKQSVGNEFVTGYDAKLSNIAILVPYSAIPKAYDIAVSLDIVNEDDTMLAIVEKAKLDIEQYKAQNKDVDTTMSSAKRTTIKVLSALAFVVLVALVVLGTDYIMELLKTLLGG